MKLTAGKQGFRAFNEQVREALESCDTIDVEDVNGQRYIGAAMDKGKTLNLHGTPGNDMGAYLNGGKIEVFGNAQEAVGNTMGGGEIIIHGHTGDTLGYAMRDGEIYVRNRAGSRAGIHMKEFENMHPTVVIGGIAGAFLAEYMAGGTLIILGLNREPTQEIVGAHCATGMHGGKIYVRGEIPSQNISANIAVSDLNEEETAELKACVKKYCSLFKEDEEYIMKEKFYKLSPSSSRPYANLYTKN